LADGLSHKQSGSSPLAQTNELLELAAGVIVTGFRGGLNAGVERALHRLPYAGYILFAENVDGIASARELTDALRAGVEPAPIVSIDQEGGRITRLRAGVENIPSMMALGAAADEELAVSAGEQIAHDLRRAGCTLDFAPVLDLALDARNTVIGTRAVGTSPALVTRIAGAFARGLERGGITPTFKHFPGHGATAFDTHLGAARLDSDERTVRERDMVPFRECARDDVPIMAAHVAVPALDGDRPATLSRVMLTGILREQWHYGGLIFTDCMQMDAIAASVGTVQGVTEAIAAGADCALISHDPDLAFEAATRLAEAVEAGRVPIARLREAHARVMILRRRATAPLARNAPAPHPDIGVRIARAAVTLVRGEARAAAASGIAIVFGEASLAAQAPALLEHRVGLDPTQSAREELLESLRAAQRRPIVLTYRAHLHPLQRQAIDAIVERSPDALVVSTGEPYDLPLFARARHVAACYGNDDVTLAGLADVVFAGVPGEGTLPVAID